MENDFRTNTQDNSITIFGYGSLMNPVSLRADVPGAKNLRTACIRGFQRVFNKLDEQGWTSNDVALVEKALWGITYCAVNITPGDASSEVNGVVFDVNREYFSALKRREQGYDLIETVAYDFENGRNLGSCWVFAAQDCSGTYAYGEPAQQKYLEVCLDAAKSNGERFYEQFLKTTYVGNKSLAEIPELPYSVLA